MCPLPNIVFMDLLVALIRSCGELLQFVHTLFAHPTQVTTFAGRMRHTLTFLSGGALPEADGTAIDTMASRFTGTNAAASTC